MSTWMYEYRKLIHEIDTMQVNIGTTYSVTAWDKIKRRMTAIARQWTQEDPSTTFELSLASAWLLWEDRLSTDNPPQDEDDIRVGELADLFVSSSPEGSAGEWGYTLEIAFALARGFTREEAIDQQEAFLHEEGGYEAVYGVSRPQPKLVLITGGKSRKHRRKHGN
jgi:hypothetical protein